MDLPNICNAEIKVKIIRVNEVNVIYGYSDFAIYK